MAISEYKPQEAAPPPQQQEQQQQRKCNDGEILFMCMHLCMHLCKSICTKMCVYMYMLSCGRGAISAYVRENSFNCGGSTRLDFKPVVHLRDWLSNTFYLFNSHCIYPSLSLLYFLFHNASYISLIFF